MPRTRKKPAAAAVTDDEISFNPAEFDPALREQAAAIVSDVASATHLPADIERQASHETGHAAAVGRRPAIVQSGMTMARTDVLAGVKLAEGFRIVGGRKVRESLIGFSERPSEEVLGAMKAAGFEYRPTDRLWAKVVKPESAWQDRAHAEETFEAMAKAIRVERNVGHSFGRD